MANAQQIMAAARVQAKLKKMVAEFDDSEVSLAISIAEKLNEAPSKRGRKKGSGKKKTGKAAATASAASKPSAAAKPAKAGKRGRPKGSKNKPHPISMDEDEDVDVDEDDDDADGVPADDDDDEDDSEPLAVALKKGKKKSIKTLRKVLKKKRAADTDSNRASRRPGISTAASDDEES